MGEGDEIEIEKVSLDDEGEEREATRSRSSDGSRSGGIRGVLARILHEVLRIVVDEIVGTELDRLSRKYRRASRTYRKVSRRLRRLHLLALVFLGVGIVAQTLALFVGVAWLSQNFPATADPLFFVAGAVVGYLVAVVAGIVYTR